MNKIIIGAAIGNCVHVAGVLHFIQLAEEEGYKSVFLGPAVEIDTLIENINKYDPDMVGISYRLTADNAELLLNELVRKVNKIEFENRVWVFGGTKPVADIANKYNIFKYISDGSDDIDDSLAFLRRGEKKTKEIYHEHDIINRINSKYPYPVLRHHFGRPSYNETLEGISKIAESKVLDVVSLGPDQNTQQYFFRKNEMKQKFNGAGGVPIRSEEQFCRLKEQSKRGNFPLMRCYSGTQDVIRFAEVLKSSIDNAWCAVPLCWYNELDGRGTRSIEESVEDAHELIKWNVKNNVPVEINEPHHWALRDAHDVMSVAMAYISAYNAKYLGVENYIAQYMFNVPNTLDFSMDLGRITAMVELVETLHSNNFKTYRQVRAGLPFLCSDMAVAKGQLAASTYLALSIKPHIIHVVGYSEALHAASAEEVIESCKIVRGVIRSKLHGGINEALDESVINRKNQLISEAKVLIDFIKDEYSMYKEPLANPIVIADCVKRGILDAPHIVKNDKFRGILKTKIVNGKCVAYSKDDEKVLSEAERIDLLLNNERKQSQWEKRK